MEFRQSTPDLKSAVDLSKRPRTSKVQRSGGGRPTYIPVDGTRHAWCSEYTPEAYRELVDTMVKPKVAFLSRDV